MNDTNLTKQDTLHYLLTLSHLPINEILILFFCEFYILSYVVNKALTSFTTSFFVISNLNKITFSNRNKKYEMVLKNSKSP